MIARVFLTSFGGGTMSMIRRAVIREHRWITEDEYLDLLSLGNLLPGSNPINIAVLIGLHVRGLAGAVVAFVASVLPGFVVLMLIGIFALDSHLRWIGGALTGCAAVAVGLTLGNAVEMTVKRIDVVQVVLIAAVAAAVLVAHLSLAWTLVVFIPVALVATRKRGGTR